jgi:hypothetical protein
VSDTPDDKVETPADPASGHAKSSEGQETAAVSGEVSDDTAELPAKEAPATDADLPATIADLPAEDDLSEAAASTGVVRLDDTLDSWDHTAAWIGKHGAPYMVGLLTILVGMCFMRIFHGELAGDDLTFHFAESARLADCIRHGDFDFWNPSGNAGFASAYYYQVLPQLTSALPTAVFGHNLFWFQFSVWLPMVIAPVCAYRGMRHMGATPWQAFASAFCINFAISASRWGFGAEGSFNVGLYTQTWALAIFPLAYGHAIRWSREGKGLAPAVAWSALVGLCHPFAVIGLGLALLVGWLYQFVGYLLSLTVPFEVNIRGYVSMIAWGVGRVSRAMAGRARDDAERKFGHEFLRLALFAALLGISQLPTLLPLLIDWQGFGGFPHRVNDEVGPGFIMLGKWAIHGDLLDSFRARQVGAILTILLPISLVFGRGGGLRWLWLPGFVFALLLGMGPHIGKTTPDDLFPAVRFLGAMQVCFALAIGAGIYSIAAWLWKTEEGTRRARWIRIAILLAGVILDVGIILRIAMGSADATVVVIMQRVFFGAISSTFVARLICMLPFIAVLVFVGRVEEAMRPRYGLRTAIATVVAVVAVLIAVPGIAYQTTRVRSLADSPYRKDMFAMNDAVAKLPQGRRQVGPGADNHWWNLLAYVYHRTPALLQMGGGGLQASPNYDYLYSVREYPKLAWVYDTPYFVFDHDKNANPGVGAKFEQVSTSSHYWTLRLPTPGLVSPIEITGVLPGGPTKAGSPARLAAIAWLKSGLPLENKHLVYAGYGERSAPPNATVLRSWHQDSPGDQADIVADVEVRAPTTFVIRESWHPRWHAYIDGKEVSVRRVTPDFPAVDAPAGAKQIALRFERPWWAQVAWLAWPGAALLGLLIERLLRRLL